MWPPGKGKLAEETGFGKQCAGAHVPSACSLVRPFAPRPHTHAQQPTQDPRKNVRRHLVYVCGGGEGHREGSSGSTTILFVCQSAKHEYFHRPGCCAPAAFLFAWRKAPFQAMNNNSTFCFFISPTLVHLPKEWSLCSDSPQVFNDLLVAVTPSAG